MNKITRQMQWMLLLLGGLTLLSLDVRAQEPGKTASAYTYAEGSPTYYRNIHGPSKGGGFVYRRDPNIWVYTPEVAKRAGMPLEWASEELKGVAAAAFRLERDGAEEDCGWGGNPGACKPVVQCVLELYFDRQEHPLPWDKDALMVDIYQRGNGSSAHLPIGPTLPNEPRTRRGLSRQPFSDPQTGEELEFPLRVIAYDREIHGRYTFVRLSLGCSRGIKVQPMSLKLQANESKAGKPAKVFHEVYLPADWYARVIEVAQKHWNRDNDFYKQTWDNMNKGAQK